MSNPDPRREAFRILRRVEDAGAFASVLLEQRASGLRDARDAGLLTELVLGVTRRRAALDHAIARAASRPIEEIDRPVLTALRLGAYALLFLDRIPAFAAVDTTVDLVKDEGHPKAAGFVNGALRKIARDGGSLLPPQPVEGDVAALALFHSHPEWWVRRWVDRAGWERASAILAADNEPAATVLAPWPPKASAGSLAASLAADGVVVASCRFAPDALRVVSGVPQHTAAFREGAFWIQDEASQLAVAIFGSAVGPRVLDVCAAPGGKTLGLAARLARPGLVVAADRNARRLSRLSQNLRRVGVPDVAPVAGDMARAVPLSGSFDDVLVDAPCSGTGTMRRHPEIRWRLSPDDLPALVERQQSLLLRAADLVRPGGRLVYSVCSVEPEEGEGVLGRFLEARKDFARSDPRPALTAAAAGLVGGDLCLRTSPLDDGMDGFFAARLTRRAH